MGNKKRVLLYSEGWGTGGIESFIMNVARALDPNEYEFEIFCTHDYDEGHDREIAELGGVRHVVFKGHKPSNSVRLIEGPNAWVRLLAERRFDVVHVNTMNGMGLCYVALAKKARVPVRIAHSHNADVGPGAHGLKMALHRFGQNRWLGAATARVACSASAGRHLFGDRSFTVLPNSVDTDRFAYSSAARQEARSELGIPNHARVMGFVGRLDPQKDPVKVVEIYQELAQGPEDVHLVLVGQGELENQVSQAVDALSDGLSTSVHRVARSMAMGRLLSAFDVLVQPSRFEGLPMTMVESQASGLPLVVSPAFPEEGVITDLVTVLDRALPAQEWAQQVVRAWSAGEERGRYANLVADSPFGRRHFADIISALYCSGGRS